MPAADPLAFRIVSTDLAKLALQAKVVAPALRRQIPKRLREAAAPIVQDAEARKPSSRIKIGLRSSLAVSRGANVRITAQSPDDPPLAGLMELGSARSRGSYIRHPVFGHDVWVNQPTRPYLKPAVDAHKTEAVRKLLELKTDIEELLRL